MDDFNITFVNDNWISALREYFTQPYTCLLFSLGFISIICYVCLLPTLCQVKTQRTIYFRLVYSLSLSEVIYSGLEVMYPLAHMLTGGRRPPLLQIIWGGLYWCSVNYITLSLMLMALDHYAAIVKPLHYERIMNNNKSSIYIVTVCIVSVIFGFSNIWIGYFVYIHQTHYKPSEKISFIHIVLNLVRISGYSSEWFTMLLQALCISCMTYAYVCVYIEVRKQQMFMIRHSIQNTQLKHQKNNQALVTTICILSTFILFTLPCYMLWVIQMFTYGEVQTYGDLSGLPEVYNYIYILPYLRSSYLCYSIKSG